MSALLQDTQAFVAGSHSTPFTLLVVTRVLTPLVVAKLSAGEGMVPVAVCSVCWSFEGYVVWGMSMNQ